MQYFYFLRSWSILNPFHFLEYKLGCNLGCNISGCKILLVWQFRIMAIVWIEVNARVSGLACQGGMEGDSGLVRAAKRLAAGPSSCAIFLSKSP
jgi:hypothetical protein